MWDNGLVLISHAEDKTFKDIFLLKCMITDYAKYLGLNPEKVIDEFNGFLFEHTSKISLEDIKMAQKKMEEEEKGATSPYTKEYKKKVGPWPFIIAIVLIVFIFIILYLIISTINKAPERTTELMSKERGNVIYEFA